MSLHARARAAFIFRRMIMKTAVFALAAFALALAPSAAAFDDGEPPAPEAAAVRVADDLVLTGTLHRPAHFENAPAVVLYPGSQGSVNLSGVAEHLASQGIVALDLNKRGVSGSDGHWRDETIERQAGDALAAVEHLRSLEGVDPARVGIAGHSQGGWVAQTAAARSPDVAFIVLLAGPSQTVKEQILTDERYHLLGWGVPEAEVDERIGMFDGLLDAALTNPAVCGDEPQHYLCGLIWHDPAETLAALDVPVLALYGERDPMTPPAENAERLETALAHLGPEGLTSHTFAEANHVFRASRTGLRDEYADLPRDYVPGFLQMISDWILALPETGQD
jgi:dipeptidyl aminopeptidase/acylaminoacyl peptidase